MSNGNKITFTVFFSLVIGVLSNALVNMVTESNSVHWDNVIYHVEFYIILVIGFIVITLSKLTAQEESDQLRVIQNKIDAVQQQGFLGGKTSKAAPAIGTVASQVQPRALEFSENANRTFKSESDENKNRIMAILKWLQYASASEIVMCKNISKINDDNPENFMLRVGRLRIDMDINLQEGMLIVKEIQSKLIA